MARPGIERTDPDRFAAILTGYAAGQRVSDLAKACGMPAHSVRKVIARLDGMYQPVTEEAKRVTTDLLIRKIEDKLPLLLDSIDREKVDKATLRDIAVAFGVLAEKRQLLKGEPTQILSYEERENLTSLLPKIKREIERRGMAIDAEFHEVPVMTVSPPDEIHEEVVSRTALRAKKHAKNRS